MNIFVAGRGVLIVRPMSSESTQAGGAAVGAAVAAATPPRLVKKKRKNKGSFGKFLKHAPLKRFAKRAHAHILRNFEEHHHLLGQTQTNTQTQTQTQGEEDNGGIEDIEDIGGGGVEGRDDGTKWRALCGAHIAIMIHGEVVCRSKPRCGLCPLQDRCQFYARRGRERSEALAQRVLRAATMEAAVAANEAANAAAAAAAANATSVMPTPDKPIPYEIALDPRKGKLGIDLEVEPSSTNGYIQVASSTHFKIKARHKLISVNSQIMQGLPIERVMQVIRKAGETPPVHLCFEPPSLSTLESDNVSSSFSPFKTPTFTANDVVASSLWTKLPGQQLSPSSPQRPASGTSAGTSLVPQLLLSPLPESRAAAAATASSAGSSSSSSSSSGGDAAPDTLSPLLLSPLPASGAAATASSAGSNSSSRGDAAPDTPSPPSSAAPVGTNRGGCVQLSMEIDSEVAKIESFSAPLSNQDQVLVVPPPTAIPPRAALSADALRIESSIKASLSSLTHRSSQGLALSAQAKGGGGAGIIPQQGGTAQGVTTTIGKNPTSPAAARKQQNIIPPQSSSFSREMLRIRAGSKVVVIHLPGRGDRVAPASFRRSYVHDGTPASTLLLSPSYSGRLLGKELAAAHAREVHELASAEASSTSSSEADAPPTALSFPHHLPIVEFNGKLYVVGCLFATPWLCWRGRFPMLGTYFMPNELFGVEGQVRHYPPSLFSLSLSSALSLLPSLCLFSPLCSLSLYRYVLCVCVPCFSLSLSLSLSLFLSFEFYFLHVTFTYFCIS